jgi:hypothetical protein
MRPFGYVKRSPFQPRNVTLVTRAAFPDLVCHVEDLIAAAALIETQRRSR